MSHAHWLAASEGAHVLATPLSGGDCSALLEHRREPDQGCRGTSGRARLFTCEQPLFSRAPALSKNSSAPGGAIHAARAAEKFWAHVPRIGTLRAEVGINIERTCCTRAAPSQRRLTSRALDQPQQPCSAGRVAAATCCRRQTVLEKCAYGAVRKRFPGEGGFNSLRRRLNEA